MIFKHLLAFILIASFWLTPQQQLSAKTCQKTFDQNSSGQPICLLQIKRSAKNYWEYRVSLKIGDRPKITRVYNCRQHSYWQADLGQVNQQEQTEQKQLEKYICRLYNKP